MQGCNAEVGFAFGVSLGCGEEWSCHCSVYFLTDPVKATDVGAEAVYEELDYSLMPEYQEVPSHTGGSTVVPRAWGCPHPWPSTQQPLLHCRLPVRGLGHEAAGQQLGW